MMVSKEADMGTKRQKEKSSEAPPRVAEERTTSLEGFYPSSILLRQTRR